MPSSKRITVSYFAMLRSERGVSQETVETEAQTADELYTTLSAKTPFTLPRNSLRVAINDVFVPWESPLSSGDHVVFIPPVAGG